MLVYSTGYWFVTFVASNTAINTPIGYKIKGQNFNAYLEKAGASEVFQLLGNLTL
jgi:hypothetical protein